MGIGKEIKSGVFTALGVLCFIGAICIGFSIGTQFGIMAIILSWVVARVLDVRQKGGAK
jgi:hypothetical protein